MDFIFDFDNYFRRVVINVGRNLGNNSDNNLQRKYSASSWFNLFEKYVYDILSNELFNLKF